MTSWKALSLPPSDHELSPYTGYTRAHWEAVADHWVNVALSYASPRFSLFRIPGRHAWSGPESDALEGFARSFLIAAPRIAGGGDPHGFAEKYASGLVAGTERGGSEGWLWAVDCVEPLTGKTQPIVEAAGIAYALHISRAQIWDRLKPAERDQIADWLSHHARRIAWANNWLLFTAVIEAFLASAGYDTSAYDGRANVRRVESWYTGQGWYTDGSRRNFDYYNAWVIHPLLWAIHDMLPARDPDAAWLWENRLGRYLESYGHLFGGNGSPLIQGRSIIYRTATLAPIWLGQLTGRTPLSPGASRRLASGTLKHFVDHGVGVDGPLSLGWHADQYLDVTQPYSGPGSPYWAGIGFHGLALPADHPVWTAVEEPQPAETGDHVVDLDATGWLISSTSGDEITRVYNHGADHNTAGTPDDDPLYVKYAYSTHTAPGTGPAFAANVDGAFVLLDGEPSRRGPIVRHRVRGPVAGSTCVPREGASLTSVSIVQGPFEVRCHLLATDAATGVREGSWAVAGEDAVPYGLTGGVAWARRADGLTAALLPVHGYERAETIARADGNVLGAHMSTPAAFGQAEGVSAHVALHFLGRSDDVTVLASTMSTAARISVDGTAVRVEWRDGQTVTVDLDTFIG
ncbi:hypothetical protein Afil01_25860 [Actinorhabdospora filicis]|uniref:DUF2264 domain-containing protein n=1 Tax=Actinorhabdospora filicis TaxID=1785913 RepID=A0A9W6W8P5_9ACTN|nr:DUF2264 domain-containing protein [Actinorhabdospora filicis]GLZ77779.1 hypothetical protein Afil01_25860 [Actinorhabdospora filicis]